MRLKDADKLKAVIIEGYGAEFFGSVLWNILDDVPTVTKADICREFKDNLKEYIDYIGVTPVIEVHRLYQILAEMEQE